MKEVSINQNMKLSEHFSLGEVTKTKHQTKDGNIPSHEAIVNLRNICEGWLEDLRFSYNRLYGTSPDPIPEQSSPTRSLSEGRGERNEEIPVIITSGYRSPEVNRLAGGAKNSNHLTGCAVDIRCMGPEQMIRYAGILLDIADGTHRDFDELIQEKRGTTYWIHFAVRPKDNRRRIVFDIR
jgi:hypothetical protein